MEVNKKNACIFLIVLAPSALATTLALYLYHRPIGEAFVIDTELRANETGNIDNAEVGSNETSTRRSTSPAPITNRSTGTCIVLGPGSKVCRHRNISEFGFYYHELITGDKKCLIESHAKALRLHNLYLNCILRLRSSTRRDDCRIRDIGNGDNRDFYQLLLDSKYNVAFIFELRKDIERRVVNAILLIDYQCTLNDMIQIENFMRYIMS